MPNLESIENYISLSYYNKVVIHKLDRISRLLDIFILEKEENGCIDYNIFKDFCKQFKISMNLDYFETSALAYGYDSNTILLEIYCDDDGGLYNE